MATKTSAGRYMRVGAKKGPLVIGGAQKKFEEDPSFTYVPLYRVAGPKDDVLEWLNENHPDRSKEALKGSYSKTSLKTKAIREAYERELENASEARANVSNTKAEMKQANLMVLVRLLKIYDEQRRSGEDDKVVGVIKANSQLKEKVKEMSSEGKVLDVTNMSENGSDSKKVVFKEGGSKRRLSQQQGDPFYNVVYNPKNKKSVQGVSNFLRCYGGFEDDKIKEFKCTWFNTNT